MKTSVRRFGHRKTLAGTSWLWLIFLWCLSSRCIGEGYYNGFEYGVSGTNIIIAGYSGPAVALTIPSSIPGVNGTVTSILNSEDIGWSSALTNIAIPSSVTSIAAGAFSWCSRLTGFTVDTQNPSYSSLDGGLFDKSQTTVVAWPPGKGGAYIIPSSVNDIGEEAFQNCSGLTNITIPTCVTTVREFAFAGCSGLTNLTIPSSVTTIGNGALVNCANLTGFTVDVQNPSYSSLNGVVFDKGQTTLVAWPTAKGGAYTIPSSVTAIGVDAFEVCSRLTSITIPSSVTVIGEGAFYGCSGLSSLIIPSSVADIGDWTFLECSGLTSLTIPTSVTAIGEGAFMNCSRLTRLTIPSSVTFIGLEAFSGCSGLTSVNIPSGVTNIGGAFSGCSRLAAFTVDTQNPSYSSLSGVLFDKNQTTLMAWPAGKGGTYTVPGSVTSIAEGAFAYCSGLTGITLPGSVTAIPGQAFAYCTGLTSITILGGVTVIGAGAFEECSSLTNVTIPTNVTAIGYSAFSDCRALTSVTIPNGVTTISALAFSDCTGLTSVTIPSSVTNIDYSAFSNCRGLTSVTIPNTVTQIGDFAFTFCTALTSVTIPSGVTSIGEWAFGDCSGLTRAYFQGDAPSTFRGTAFTGTAGPFSIYYPSTASGWSTPTWQGYPAQPYQYQPAGQQPALTLTLSAGAVTPSFNNLQPGMPYQLQVSSDLKAWNNAGVAFTATNASEAYGQPFHVTDRNQLFFRLQSVP